MRYIIMANGKGARWGNYNGVPKHLIQIDGETLLARTTRLVHAFDPSAEVVVTSSNPAYDTRGARRHTPAQYKREIDRFCYELIDDDTCFLYGDVFYMESAMRCIVEKEAEGLHFFGDGRAILAVKVSDGSLMRGQIDELRAKIDAGVIEDAKGWHLFYQFEEMTLGERDSSSIFTLIEDGTAGFNCPEELDAFLAKRSAR